MFLFRTILKSKYTKIEGKFHEVEVPFFCVFAVLFAVQGFIQDPTFTPTNLRLVRATYTRITVKWQPGSSPTQAASYKILRNNTEVGTSSETQYTDSNLQTGTEYVYKVIAVSSGGENSPESVAISVKTSFSSRRNSHGPLFNAEKWPTWTGSDSFYEFTGKFNLVPCGLLKAPKVVIKK